MKCDDCIHLKETSLVEEYCVDGYWSSPKYEVCDLDNWTIDLLKSMDYDFENCKRYKKEE